MNINMNEILQKISIFERWTRKEKKKKIPKDYYNNEIGGQLAAYSFKKKERTTQKDCL